VYIRADPWAAPVLDTFALASRGNTVKLLAEMSLSSAPISDANVVDSAVLPAPEFLARRIPRPPEIEQRVQQNRGELHDIIFGDDRRLLIIVGPCSIHDTTAGHEYATRLAKLAGELDDRLKIVMRVYFEKPRTTVGWKGLIMDPTLDGQADLPLGLETARRFLLDVLALGLPTATELLDPITPQYISDLVCWSAIGARTTESQTHRQMASGLSMPLGFKNGTSGDLQVAINAIKAARAPQTFLGISHQGLASAVTTKGNPACHVILRGGSNGPNYDADSVQETAEKLRAAQLPPAVVVDCSHGNSDKDPANQPAVLADIIKQTQNPDSPLIGVMLESNLVSGNQKFPQPLENLTYGQSITDGCIDWATTEACLREAYDALGGRFG